MKTPMDYEDNSVLFDKTFHSETGDKVLFTRVVLQKLPEGLAKSEELTKKYIEDHYTMVGKVVSDMLTEGLLDNETINLVFGGGRIRLNMKTPMDYEDNSVIFDQTFHGKIGDKVLFTRAVLQKIPKGLAKSEELTKKYIEDYYTMAGITVSEMLTESPSDKETC